MFTKERLQKIREFAEKQFEVADGDSFGLVTVYDQEHDIDICNPWIDSSFRFPLTDDEAVKEYGLDVVMEFCKKAEPYAMGYTTLFYQYPHSIESRKLVVSDTKETAESLIQAEIREQKKDNKDITEVDLTNAWDGKNTYLTDEFTVYTWVRFWT